jgi:hypothetical protein
MKNSYVLGICGHAGAGKDMVADYLVKELGFVRMALADPIKEIAHDYFGVSYDTLRKSDKPEKVRWLLQQLGTEIGRTYDPEIWTKTLCNRIQASPEKRLVITDVRFPNEAEALVTGLGADLILIRRPKNPNIGKEMMHHASETSIQDIPFDLFRTAFLNLEGKKDELLQEVLLNVKEWVRCHASRMNPDSDKS